MIINTVGPTAAIDTINSDGVVIQFLGTWNGNVQVEGSSDQAAGSWRPICVDDAEGFGRPIITGSGTFTVRYPPGTYG